MQITNTWQNCSETFHTFVDQSNGTVLDFHKEVVMNQQFGLGVLKHQHLAMSIPMVVI